MVKGGGGAKVHKPSAGMQTTQLNTSLSSCETTVVPSFGIVVVYVVITVCVVRILRIVSRSYKSSLLINGSLTANLFLIFVCTVCFKKNLGKVNHPEIGNLKGH